MVARDSPKVLVCVQVAELLFRRFQQFIQALFW